MSNLDDAMIEQMAYLVFRERRPFSYLDFLSFEIDGQQHKMARGTFRNKVSKLVRNGQVEVAYMSGLAFYTLKGVSFGKLAVTPSHTGVHNPILKLIENLPMDKRALHDIRLRFKVQDIWSILSTNSDLSLNPISKDIGLKPWITDGLLIKITIHKTNTVTVIVGCSYEPVAVDINGIIRLSNALTRTEEHLTKLVENCGSMITDESRYNHRIIPAHSSWLVTMWHFGADSLVRYAGQRFEVVWELGQEALIRAYTKDFEKKGTRIRLERQEYPNKTFAEALEEKLNGGHAYG
jgi:hypothetical protein